MQAISQIWLDLFAILLILGNDECWDCEIEASADIGVNVGAFALVLNELQRVVLLCNYVPRRTCFCWG